MNIFPEEYIFNAFLVKVRKTERPEVRKKNKYNQKAQSLEEKSPEATQ